MTDPRCQRPHHLRLDPTPPVYSCAIFRRAHFLLKREFDNPIRASLWNRQWKRVDVEICGTVLQITSDKRVVRMSLLGGDAGLARDYGKRSNVLRLRVEGRQFLLAADTLGTAIDWVDSLHAAFAIAPPLEYRCEPSFRRLPWKHDARRDISLTEKLHKKWREQWRVSSRNNLWLTAQSRLTDETDGPEDDDPSLLPARKPGADDLNNRWSVLSTASDSSAWTMFSHADSAPADAAARRTTTATATATRTPPSGPLVRIGTSPAPPKHRIASDQSREKYARVLLYDSPWKGSWYFRDGHIYLCRRPVDDPGDSKWI